MMNLNEVVESKNVCKLVDFLYERSANNIGLTDSEKDVINSTAFEDDGSGTLHAKVNKIMNLDIFRSEWDMFDKLNVWKLILSSAINQLGV